MSGIVIDLLKYLDKEDLIRLSNRSGKLPDVYNIRLATTYDERGLMLEYWISNKKLRETRIGHIYTIEHLLQVIVHMCEDDRSLIIPLLEYLINIALEVTDGDALIIDEIERLLEYYRE